MSFLEDYMLMTENSSPAKEFHIGTMLSVLSTFAGKRFWFPFGPYTYYTHLYIGLVGPPGLKKSAAMDRGKNIVRCAKVCPIAASQETKEFITQSMSGSIDGKPKKTPFAGQKFVTEPGGHKREYNQYAIFATELVDFISVNPQGFLDFLTTVWSEPAYEVNTKHQGQDLIVGPYISMIACMTPEKLKGYLKQSILTGGFARRTMWFFSTKDNAVPWPTYTPEQQAAERRCIDFYARIKDKSGEFSLSPETREFYEDWFKKNHESKKDRAPCTQGWYESKGEILFKLSMLIALAEEGGERLVIELPYYKQALHYCRLVEENLERVFEGAGINPSAAAATQICRMLEGMDYPMNKKHIEAMFFDQVPNLNELRDTLSHLVSVGRLAERTVLSPEGALAGTVIGTPSSIARYKDSELRAFLKRRDEPRDESSGGSSSGENPPSTPGSPPQG